MAKGVGAQLHNPGAGREIGVPVKMYSRWPKGRYQTEQGLLRRTKPGATLSIIWNSAPNTEAGSTHGLLWVVLSGATNPQGLAGPADGPLSWSFCVESGRE